MFTNLITTKSSLLLVPNTMQKNRWQLIDPFIVKSCSVPILTSEKCWSPGPEPVKEPAKIYLLFQNIFSQQDCLIFHVKQTAIKFWSLTSVIYRRQKQTEKKNRENKVTFFRRIFFAYYLFIYCFTLFRLISTASTSLTKLYKKKAFISRLDFKFCFEIIMYSS